MPTALGTIASQHPASAGGPPLTGMWVWYGSGDADFVDAGGGKVSKWKDHNGTTARDLIGYGGSSLVARGGSQNGNKFCTFYVDQTDGVFYASSGGVVPQDNVSIFAVARTRDTENRHAYIGWGNTLFHHSFAGPRYGVYHQYAGGLIDGGPELLNTWTIEGYVRDTTTARVRRDGTEMGTSTNAPNVGGELWVGADYYQVGYRLNSDVGEVIAYSRVLNAGEIAQVEDYLRTKWGTP